MPLFSSGLLESPEFIPENAKPRAIDGVLDLRDHDFEAIPLLELRGEWEFFQGEFIQPGSTLSPDLFLEAGTSWNGQSGYPAHGFGSYRLTLLLPPGGPDSLKLEYQQINTAARIFWNGELAARSGRPASSADIALGQWKSGITNLLPTGGREVELIIHASNYHDLNGGMVDHLVLGRASSIESYFYGNLALNFFIAGVILIMALYHLFLFFTRYRDSAPFWFAMAALFLGLRALVVDSFPLSIVVPEIGLFPVLRLNYLSFSVSLLAISLFIYHSYPTVFGRWVTWLSVTGSILYSLAILFLHPGIFTDWLVHFQIFALVIAPGLLVQVLIAVFRRKELSLTFAAGFLTVFFTAVFDIIKTILLLPLPSLSSLGMVLFIVILSLNLSRRTSRALESAENLSAQLQEINNAMERFVPREFLKFLKKKEITEIGLGDHAEATLTILFADLKAFTRIAEENDAQEVFNLINSFLADMGPAIRSHKGFVDKYLGDGIMALFSGNSSNAIHAAIEMHQSLDRLNQKRAEEGLSLLEMGIGIHTGNCMLGTIGEEMRMDGTVISDAVNLSFRLQSLTRQFHNRILISADALDNAMGADNLYLRSIGSFRVKGRDELVDVIEVINGDPPELWKQKRASRKVFEKAVYLSREGRHDEARELFRECKKTAPDDGAVEYYLSSVYGNVRDGNPDSKH